MNKKLLLRMADHIETIPQEDFDMGRFRADDDRTSISCNSVGCALGHCLHLFSKEQIEYDLHEEIDFFRTAKHLDLTNSEWKWCFSGDWCYKDNTPKGAAKRIRMLANGEVSRAWLIEWCDWTNIKY